MINGTDLKFADISSEEERVYVFASGGEGLELTIEKPLWLKVIDGGGHRILDAEGTSYYIAPGWVAIYWKTKAGQPNFVK